MAAAEDQPENELLRRRLLAHPLLVEHRRIEEEARPVLVEFTERLQHQIDSFNESDEYILQFRNFLRNEKSDPDIIVFFAHCSYPKWRAKGLSIVLKHVRTLKLYLYHGFDCLTYTTLKMLCQELHDKPYFENINYLLNSWECVYVIKHITPRELDELSCIDPRIRPMIEQVQHKIETQNYDGIHYCMSSSVFASL